MRLLRTIVERIKHGYKIAEECYLAGGTRDSDIVRFKDRKIEIFMERQPGKPSMLIYPSKNRRWLPPHEHDPVSDADYSFVIDAVVKHYEQRGEMVELRPPH